MGALPDFHILGWECDRALVRFAAAIIFAVRIGWPAGPLNSAGSLPEAWPCANIFKAFGGRFRSRTFVAFWRQIWELRGASRDDEP